MGKGLEWVKGGNGSPEVIWGAAGGGRGEDVEEEMGEKSGKEEVGAWAGGSRGGRGAQGVLGGDLEWCPELWGCWGMLRGHPQICVLHT